MSASLRAFVSKALERNRVSFGDLRRLQRTVLPHGLVTRKQAEVLIALDQTIARTDKTWAGYLVAAITNFVHMVLLGRRVKRIKKRSTGQEDL
jgi:hypothetical protein